MRQLISESDGARTYRVTDATGIPTGWDVEPIPTTGDVNTATLRTRAQQALATNSSYLQLGTPTAAQVALQVQRLTRQQNAVIRLLLGLVDTIESD